MKAYGKCRECRKLIHSLEDSVIDYYEDIDTIRITCIPCDYKYNRIDAVFYRGLDEDGELNIEQQEVFKTH